ncbi:MAG: DRTGG domain-containing protein [Candidatus Aminicenantes bacterium]|nr:DRTGG domain-containing protein [Candidatus Aminicenantes bacterium]
MNLAEIVEGLNLKIFTRRTELARTISGGYVSDLLSDVMAHGQKDHLWITLQVHPNIVAVAVLKELAAIVLVNGRQPAPETIEQAEHKRVPLVGTSLSAFELVGRLYGLGIKG